MSYIFGAASTRRVKTCHKDIQIITAEVIAVSTVDFTVTDGLRDEKAQQKAFDSGNSKAKFGQSPHNYEVRAEGGCPAVDLVPYINGKLDYTNDAAFDYLAALIRRVNKKLLDEGIVKHLLIWGNDWDNDGVEVEDDPDENFVDKPHWQFANWKELV